jgi:hypothetical protein
MSVCELERMPRTAVLDEAHVGHIQGALGTIAHGDVRHCKVPSKANASAI